MSKDKQATPQSDSPVPKVTLYPAWCKRCGNCVAFCPRHVFETDQWGYPRVARPERCVNCHLCEMLCPDFALSVGDPAHEGTVMRSEDQSLVSAPESHVSPEHSPERMAPVPEAEEQDDE